jgi:hypothetical protein
LTKKYEPENLQNSGGILARQTSLDDLENLVRVGASKTTLFDEPNENALPKKLEVTKSLVSQTQQPSRSLLKPKNEEDEPWAEIAKFN